MGDVPSKTKVESVNNATRLTLILEVFLAIIVTIRKGVHKGTLSQNLVKDNHALKKIIKFH